MTYATNLEQEGINAQFLCLLKPRRVVSTWTLVSGSIYKASFTLGYVSAVASNGSALTAAGNNSVTVGQYFWDDDNQEIYAYITGGGDPDTTTMVATYEIYAATYDAHWHRIPTDTSTRTVYWEPIVSQTPSIEQTVEEVFFGILPTFSTSLTLNNPDKILNQHLYHSSFNKAEIDVYHWLGNLEDGNLKKVFTGRMSNHVWRDDRVDFTVNSSIDFFDKEFRLDQTLQKWDTSNYAALDTTYEGHHIRYVYGVVEGLRAINLDLGDTSNPTTSDNRVYGICGEGSDMFAYSATVPASPSSTTTRTYVDDATGFTVGDSVHLDKSTDEYVIVTNVDYASNYIEHATLSSGAATTNDTVNRGAVARVEIKVEDQIYLPQYVRDYSETVDGNGVLTITFVSGLETNLSIADTLSGLEEVSVKVYGKQNDVQLSASAYGADDTSTGNLLTAPVILVDLLKRYAGVSEADLNIASFTAALTDAPDRLGFAIPQDSGESVPTFKELIAKICSSTLLSFYQNEDLEWEVARIDAPGAQTFELEDDEILEGSLEYDFDYVDLYSDVRVDFGYREINETTALEGGYRTETATNTTARYLHEQDRELTLETLHYNRSDAATLATRLAAIYGDRQGRVALTTKNRLFEVTIDDILRVTRPSLPGFAYDEETDRSLDLNVRTASKGLRQVGINSNDLKGVSDNSGSF